MSTKLLYIYKHFDMNPLTDKNKSKRMSLDPNKNKNHLSFFQNFHATELEVSSGVQP